MVAVVELLVAADVVKAVLAGQFEDSPRVECYHFLTILRFLYLDPFLCLHVEEVPAASSR